MNEYINIVWGVIEHSATLLEGIIITAFLVNMLGYKNPKHHFATFLTFTIISYINSTFISLLIPLDSIIGTIQILIGSVFAICFLRGNMPFKIIVSSISVFFILIINSIVLTIMSNIFDTPIYILISSSGILRIAVLFLTKSIYFIVTRLTVQLAKSFTIKLSKGETYYVVTVFLLSIVIGNILFEIISSNQYSAQISMLIFVILILVNVANLIIIKKLHQISVNKACIERIAQEVLKQNEKIEFLYKIHSEMNKNSPYDLLSINNIVQNPNEYYVNYSNLNAVINNAIKECSEKNILINCNVSPYIHNFPENDIAAIISNILKESVTAYNKYEYKPYIDLEILNKNKYLSIIVSHYIRMPSSEPVNKSQNNETIPFNPYRNKIINHILAKYNGEIMRIQKGDKIITNIWFDFSLINSNQ